MTPSDLTTLGIALGLGMLVGLQKERLNSAIAGIRTFTLITVFGAICAMVAKHFEGAWIIALGGLSIALLLGVANFKKPIDEEKDIGQTTEIAALLMFAIGAYLVVGSLTVGVVVGAAVALLLYLKRFLSTTISRLGEKDMEAIMLFVAISLVILPVLPNKDFGPYEVFNLREIWLMVVLIVGISVVGYFAYKWLGTKVGSGLNGILGGLVSSTATTVSYSRKTKNSELTASLAGFVIMTASTIAFVRVLIEVSVVAPHYLSKVAPPLITFTVVMAIISGALYFFKKDEDSDFAEPKNPAQFKTAIVFAILYGLILLAVAYVKEEFGQAGLYIVSIISGLTDMDAITLSLSNMMNDGKIEGSNGWRLILVAGLSNLLFKGGMAAVIGNRSLMKIIAPTFGIAIVIGLLFIWLWPN